MLEESGIIASRSEDNRNASVVVHVVHHIAKKVGIVAVICNGIRGKCGRRYLSAYATCNHRIACTGRDAEVVFKHIPFVVLSLYEVDA